MPRMAIEIALRTAIVISLTISNFLPLVSLTTGRALAADRTLLYPDAQGGEPTTTPTGTVEPTATVESTQEPTPEPTATDVISTTATLTPTATATGALSPTFTATLTPTATATFTPTATAMPTPTATLTPTATATLTPTLPLTPTTAMQLSKTSPTTATAGEPFTYTLTLTNSGSVTATHLVITDVIPFPASYITGGIRSGDVVSWTLESLPPYSSQDFTYVVTATETITNSEYAATAEGGVFVRGEAIVVTEIYPPLTPDFSAFPQRDLAPALVQFLNLSTGDIDGYLWHFGDVDLETGQPFTSTQVSPAHTYQTPGVYTVTLALTGLSGTATLTRPHYITVTEPVTASFYAQPITGTAPLTVTFNSTTTGASTLIWDFGDTHTQTITGSFILPPNAITHTYTQPGAYTVTLFADGPEGSDTLTRTSYITVTRAVTASFVAFPYQGYAPVLVQFLNTSTGEIDDYLWDFGDTTSGEAVTSTLSSPTHTYTSGGVYTVSLHVNGPEGSDTLTRTNYITVTEPVLVTVADTGGNPEAGLPVYVFDGTTYTGQNGTTDAGGQIAFNLPAGNYRFRVDKNGTQFWSGTGNHCQVPECTEVIVTTSVPVVVSVLDTAGTPQDGLAVYAFDESTYTNYSKTTDDAGQATFTLPLGEYRFRADKNGTQFWSSETNHCPIPGCVTRTVTTSVPVSVTIADTDGTLETGLRVYAFDGSTYTGFNKTTDAAGQATFTLPLGEYRFRADKNGTQFWSSETNHCPIPGCVTTAVTTTVPVSVTVTDADGAPEAGLRVYVFDGATYTGFNKTTDAQGQAIFTLPMGEYRFRMDKNGTQFWSGETNHCSIPGCTTVTAITSVPVVVEVKDTSGAAEAGLQVYVFDGSTYTGFNKTTDAQGQAVFTLPNGNYRFRADKNGIQFWSSETNHCAIPGCVTAGVTTTIPVAVTVLDSSGNPESGLPIYVFDETTYTGFNQTTTTTGQVTFTLPVGDYRFRTDKNGTQYWSDVANHCPIPGCITATVTTASPDVTVTVQDTTGQAESGLRVYVFDETTYTGYNQTTNESGQVTFTLPEGDYRFRADKNSTQFWSSDSNHCLVPGCGSAIVTTTVPISVTVVDTNGTLESGLRVYAFDGTTYTGFNKTTGATGQATFTLPLGDYRFRADKNGTQFWSGDTNHCSLPGCTTTVVTTSVPVSVTVTDTDGTLEAGLRVYAFDGTTYTGFNKTTDTEGQATFTLPLGDYRFRADKNSTQFWSGDTNHCPIPGCVTTVVTTTVPVSMTVINGGRQPQSGLRVYAFDGATYTGFNKTTDAEGQALFTLSQGDYRFRVDQDGQQYWSGESNHCGVPGCITITVTLPGGELPSVADFSATPVQGNSPLTVTFTSTSTGATALQWHFGDGGTDIITSSTSLTSPLSFSHSYTQSGVYTVNLTAIGPGGTTVVTRSNYITVTEPVVADFYALPLTGTVPLTVTFINSSTGATTYLWDFGDGETDSAISPTHTYTQSGIYSVVLNATGPGGNDVLTRTGYISVQVSTVSITQSRIYSAAGQTTIPADGQTTAQLIVEAVSAAGNPIPGAEVELEIVTGSAELIQPAGYTDENGQVTGSIRSNVPGEVQVSARINGELIEDSVTLIFTGPDLVVTMSGSPHLIAGLPATYTLTMHNTGAVTATQAVLTDSLPSGLSFAHQTNILSPPAEAASFAQIGSDLVWQVAELGIDHSLAVTLVVTVDGGLAENTLLTNIITATGQPQDLNVVNNTAQVAQYVEILQAELALSPAEPALAIRPGQTGVLTMTLDNVGQLPAAQIAITTPIVMPWVNAIPSEITALEPGEQTILTLNIAPPANVPPGTYRDFVIAAERSSGSEQRAVLKVDALPAVRDLQLTVENDQGVVIPNALVRLRMSNGLVDVTPAFYNYHSIYFEGYTDNDGQLLLADVPVGTYDYFTVQATDHETYQGMLTMSSGTGQQAETVILIGQPDLRITATSTYLGMPAGQNGSLEFTIDNPGAASLSGLTLSLTGPAGDLPWVYLAAPENLAAVTLAPGDALQFSLLAAAPADQGSYEYQNNRIVVQAAGGLQEEIPFVIQITEAVTGDLAVEVVDTDGITVTGAAVTLVQQAVTTQVVGTRVITWHKQYTGRTGSTGVAMFSNLPVGGYNYQVTQSGYESAVGSLVVVAPTAANNQSLVTLKASPFNYEWEVTPTEEGTTIELHITQNNEAEGLSLVAPARTWRYAVPCSSDTLTDSIPILNPSDTTINLDDVQISAPGVDVTLNNYDSVIPANSIGYIHVTGQRVSDVLGQGTLQLAGSYLAADTDLVSMVVNPSSMTDPNLPAGQLTSKPYTLTAVGGRGDSFGIEWVDPDMVGEGWITLSGPVQVNRDESVQFDLNVTPPNWLIEGQTYLYEAGINLVESEGQSRTGTLHIEITKQGQDVVLYTTFELGAAPEIEYQLAAAGSINAGIIECPADGSGEEPPTTGGDGWDWEPLPGGGFSGTPPPGEGSGSSFPDPPVTEAGGSSGEVTGESSQEISLDLSQELIQEGEGFLAQLTLTSLLADQAVEDIQVTLMITDDAGSLVTDQFVIVPEDVPTVLGDLAGGTQLAQQWSIMPDFEVTDSQGQDFRITAQLAYDFNGTHYEFVTLPRQFTVYPTPELVITYELPGPDQVCTVFDLVATIDNVGQGPARNVRLAGGFPAIVGSTGNTAQSFGVQQVWVNGQPVADASMAVALGNIAPGSSGVIRWRFTTQQPARFVGFSSDYQAGNYYGATLEPIIREINTQFSSSGGVQCEISLPDWGNGSTNPGSSGSGVTYTAGGTIVDESAQPASGVTVYAGNGATAVTDAGGVYTFTGLLTGTYSLVPAADGRIFSPTLRSVTVPPTTDQANFTALTGTTYAISGRVVDTDSGAGLAGVSILSNAGLGTTTDANGDYSLSGLADGVYVVYAQYDDYSFSPARQPVTLSGSDVTAVDFSGSSQSGGLSTISGYVFDESGQPLPGVTVSAGDAETVTDAYGHYLLTDLTAGQKIVAPVKSGYIFAPASRRGQVPPSVAGVNFVGSSGTTYAVSGQVRTASGQPIPDVQLLSNLGLSARTDGSGAYYLPGLPADNIYTLTPTRSGYNFAPISTTIEMSQDQTGRDFVGALQLTVSSNSPNQQGSATELTAVMETPDPVTVTWDFGDSISQTSSSLVISHTYPAIGVYTATVTATDGIDIVTTTTPITITGLLIRKIGPVVVAAGEPITYTLTVSNLNQTPVANVVITDEIPSNAAYVAGGIRVGQVVSWTLPSLAANAGRSVQLVVTATSQVTNSRYGVTAYGGLAGTGTEVVTTYVTLPLTRNWRLITTTLSPPVAGEHAMAYDRGRDMVILYGGNAEGWPYENTTWEFDGTAWTVAISETTAMPARYGAAMAYDPVRQVTVLFGGGNSMDAALDQTWEYDGTAWSQVAGAVPAPRTYHSMAAAGNGDIYLFGGNADEAYYNDLWLYRNGDWQEISVTGDRPVARTLTALTYDPFRQQLLLFGGRSITGTLLADLWAFDVNTGSWQLLDDGGGGGPPARYAHSLTFDPVTGNLVLVGGAVDEAETLLGDTWHYGSSWTQATPATALPPRAYHQTVFTDDNLILFSDGEVWQYE